LFRHPGFLNFAYRKTPASRLVLDDQIYGPLGFDHR
jgi:hypothetical protein